MDRWEEECEGPWRMHFLAFSILFFSQLFLGSLAKGWVCELVDGWTGGEMSGKRDERMDYILARDSEFLIHLPKLNTLAKRSIPH